MTTNRSPDPVDLMLAGKFDQAAAAYMALYIDASRRGNLGIGADLLMGLYYCAAGMICNDPVTDAVEAEVKAQLTEHHVKIDSRVADDLQIARSMVRKAKEKAERSVTDVESKKTNR